MAIDSYTVGLVVSAAGITHAQIKWVQKALTEIRKNLGPVAEIQLAVVGIHSTPKNHFGLHHTLTAKHWPKDVKVNFLAGVSGLTREASTHARAQRLEHCDEVWCLPCFRQSNRLSKTRPALSYWYGAQSHHPHRYKWIPPWVGELDSYTKPQPKELPWRTK